MFGNVQALLYETLIAVAAIIVLDLLRKGWRGWLYYSLAFIAVLVMQAVFFVGGAVVTTVLRH